MHDVIIVGIPLLAILAGIFFNNSNSNSNTVRIEARIDKLEGRVDRSESSLSARLDRMQADLSQFYMILGKHEGKIESLEKRP